MGPCAGKSKVQWRCLVFRRSCLPEAAGQPGARSRLLLVGCDGRWGTYLQGSLGGGEGDVENSTTFIDHGYLIGSLLKNLENQGRKNVRENHKLAQPN